MGSYQLEESLGVGGMGEVWSARHRLLARAAAIKLIKPEVLGRTGGRQSTLVDRFEREAQATATLRSPHTVELFDFGETQDGTFYYVMELLDGVDLQTLIERFGPQPPERVVHILRQVCHSLYEAHTMGLVHRDIKPSNVYLCRYGTDLDFVKVLDFGLVKQRTVEANDQHLTQAGAIFGTPSFIPPEMAAGSTDVDGRADIYALGCVGYWLLTGQPVFTAPSAMAVIIAHARNQPEPPSTRLGSPIPSELEAIVLRCLAKDRDARPQTALELSSELEAIGLAPAWSSDRRAEWWRGFDETREHQPSPSAKPGEAKRIPATVDIPI